MKDDGQLSKSLTVEGIAAAIARQKKIALDRKLIQLENPISSIGEYEVPLAITLGSGQQARVQVIVST